MPPREGSAVAGVSAASTRPFDFERDVFAFENELYWIYERSPETGALEHRPRENVRHGQRCTAMARAVRSFHRHARFVPDGPRLAAGQYAERVSEIVGRDPREAEAGDAVAIPGYPDLRSFSADHGDVLREALGGRWRSYLQRGNWRMVFPFAPRQQRATAEEMLADLARGDLPIVRLVTFPRVRINHTVLVFDADAGPSEIRFRVYDPNDSAAPTELVFARASASFSYTTREYFEGGTVYAYEIFDGFFF